MVAVVLVVVLHTNSTFNTPIPFGNSHLARESHTYQMRYKNNNNNSSSNNNRSYLQLHAKTFFFLSFCFFVFSVVTIKFTAPESPLLSRSTLLSPPDRYDHRRTTDTQRALIRVGGTRRAACCLPVAIATVHVSHLFAASGQLPGPSKGK